MLFFLVCYLLLTVSTNDDTILHSLQLSFHLGADVASKISEPLQGSASFSDSGQGQIALVTIECGQVGLGQWLHDIPFV